MLSHGHMHNAPALVGEEVRKTKEQDDDWTFVLLQWQ
jgi:hypothetical protein